MDETRLHEFMGELVNDTGGAVGCGHGAVKIIMAQAFPKSRFLGFDFHKASIDGQPAMS